jgi:hypothetical protein
MSDEFTTVLKAGSTVTTGASSTAITLPTNTGGAAALAVRVVALTGGAYIKFGQSGVTATSSDILVTTTPEIFNVAGCSHIAYLQAGSAQTLNITPVEA